MSINQRLRQVRQAVELTQTKFANRIAISFNYLAEMELGKKNVNERIIRLVSMEFGVVEHWLRTGEGSMFSDEVDASMAKITSLFRSMNPLFQECALNQLSELAEVYDLISKHKCT